MKKVIIISVILILSAISIQVAGHHYRYELHEMAVDFETSQAGLVAKTGQMGSDSFAYLEGPKVEGQESIIMLHGFGGSKENWLRFSGFFTDQYHVIALDLSGHGDNKRDMEKSYSVFDQVEHVKQVAKSLGIDQFHLVGNSMGGAISSLYASMYPEQVLKVILISPAGVHDAPSEIDEALKNGADKNPLIAKSEEEFDDLLDFVMEVRPFIPGPVFKVEAEKAVSRIDINERIFKFIRADFENGMKDKLKQIKAPVLMIWGDQDRAINIDNMKEYAALVPNASTLALEGIGHLAMVEVPEVSANAMLEFIQ